ncbi:MAG: ABC transporter ATP-binding protein [bacterium]
MSTLFPIYRRLFGYTKPYRFRLIVGLLAGCTVGGSMFGMFQFAPEIIRVLQEDSAVAGAPAGRVPAVTTAAVAAGTITTPTVVVAAAPAAAHPSGTLGMVNRIATKLHLPTTRADGGLSWQFMLLTVIGLPLCVLLRSAATYINHYQLRWVGSKVVTDLRDRLFETLQEQSLRFFSKCDIGQLISRCTYDATMVENAISTTVADLVQAPFEIMAAVVFIVMFAWQNHLLSLVVTLFLIFPVCIIPVIVLGRYVKRYTTRALERISDLVSRMQENFTGIRVVKAYHTELQEAERFRTLNRSYFRSIIRALRAELLMTPLMELVAVTSACGFIAYCYGTGVRLEQIVAIGAPAILAYRPIKQLAKINSSLQRSMAAAERLFALLDTNLRLPEAKTPIRPTTFAHEIVFDDVSFRYDPSAPLTLDAVRFRVARGQVIAFVGETGAGKTTIANLLARFYDPDHGRITMDGADLRQIAIPSLRQLIGVVNQETILFNDTIAVNIAYGTPGATRDQIVAAAAKANAHEFIMAESEGYERVVGEKGFRLSGGQRQRIAIARAILKNPPILILDEATSALDTVTEKLVQEAIFQLMQERTVFAIAHRLSTIQRADCIHVLDRGRILESGSHAELYAANGTYRHLCDTQFGDTPEDVV